MVNAKSLYGAVGLTIAATVFHDCFPVDAFVRMPIRKSTPQYFRFLSHALHSNAFNHFITQVKPVKEVHPPVVQQSVTPGFPLVVSVDKEKNIAFMKIAVSGEATSEAFSKACEVFNEDVRTSKKKSRVTGFRASSTLPAQTLFSIFGEAEVKAMCANFLGEQVQQQCELTGQQLVGRCVITDFHAVALTPGMPHVMDVECRVLPAITYEGEGGEATADGYKGLRIAMPSHSPALETAFQQTRDKLMARHTVLRDVPVTQAATYQAQLGDVVTGKLRAFLLNDDGSRGDKIQAGVGDAEDNVQIPIKPDEFNPDVVMQCVGCVAGETRSFDMTFPAKASGPAAYLSGKSATCELVVEKVQHAALPAWDDELAGRVREGWTLATLEAEIRAALQEEVVKQQEGQRNELLIMALVDRTRLNSMPEELLEEVIQARYKVVLNELRKAGTSEDELRELQTPERYAEYRQATRAKAELTLKMGMALQDVAAKEGLAVPPEEIDRHLTQVMAQMKASGDAQRSEEEVRSELVTVLERNAVFDFLARHAVIEYVEEQREGEAELQAEEELQEAFELK